MRSLVIATLCLAAAAQAAVSDKAAVEFVSYYLYKEPLDDLYELVGEWEKPERRAGFLELFSSKVAEYFEAYLGTPQLDEAGIAKMVGSHNAMRFHHNRELKDLVWKRGSRARAIAVKICLGQYDPQELCNKRYNIFNTTESIDTSSLVSQAFTDWESYSNNMENNSNPNYCPKIRERMLSSETRAIGCNVAECQDYTYKKADYKAVVVCDYW